MAPHTAARQAVPFEPFFDGLSDGICVSDGRGKLVYLNPAAERLLDITLAKAEGKNFCELLCGHISSGDAPPCAASCELRQPGTSARSVTFHGRFGPKETYDWQDFHIQRRSTWIDLRVRCLKADLLPGEEPRHLTVIEDATREVDFERHREDWREMVAHDLRSPLTNVYAVIRLLQEAAEGQSTPPTKEIIDISARSCGKILELLTLYLDVAKLDAGVADVRLEPVDLTRLVADAVEEQSALAGRRKVEITGEVAAGLEAVADRELLARVLDNLLNNAVKYSREGGRVTVSARPGGRGVLLSVRDDGPGIPAEDLPFIFDRFYQAKARRAGKLMGTGLGLTFCREALKAMKGSVDAVSEPGQGTELVVDLPKPRLP